MSQDAGLFQTGPVVDYLRALILQTRGRVAQTVNSELVG